METRWPESITQEVRPLAHRVLQVVHTFVGFIVFATARKVGVLDDLASMGMITLQLDVTNDESIQAAKERVAELAHGKLDVLVNNA